MISIDIDHFRTRILQDCLTEATASYWIRRAQAFEEAAPRPGDRHGNISTGEEPWQEHQCNTACRARLRERWKECMDTALACRRHAELIMSRAEISDEVWDVLKEVA